jgi:phosphoserine phosphatase
MNSTQPANEITRESLVSILEIMHRLASPDAMPELLKEVIEVGKLAIVAEGGVLWLLDQNSQQLVMVVPSLDPPQRIPLDDSWAGRCATSKLSSNIAECRSDPVFQEFPLHLADMETRSLLNVPILGQDNLLLGVMQWVGAMPGQFDKQDEWISPALAAQAAIAIQNAYMTDELLASAILNKEVAVAREIQMSTLPESMPCFPGYDLHGHFQPTDHTGGDLYDLVILDGRLFILLGDATGHGFGPALSATQLQAMLRVSFRLGADLDEAYRHVNNQMVEDLPDDRFITAFTGFLDADTHTVNYHSGGQGPILHFHAHDERCDWYKPTSYPLGVLELEDKPTSASLELQPGDILALISDGVYEYNNEHGEQFGEARVAEVFRLYHTESMSNLNLRLMQAIKVFSGAAAQQDDITLVLVKRMAN